MTIIGSASFSFITRSSLSCLDALVEVALSNRTSLAYTAMNEGYIGSATASKKHHLLSNNIVSTTGVDSKEIHKKQKTTNYGLLEPQTRLRSLPDTALDVHAYISTATVASEGREDMLSSLATVPNTHSAPGLSQNTAAEIIIPKQQHFSPGTADATAPKKYLLNTISEPRRSMVAALTKTMVGVLNKEKVPSHQTPVTHSQRLTLPEEQYRSSTNLPVAAFPHSYFNGVSTKVHFGAQDTNRRLFVAKKELLKMIKYEAHVPAAPVAASSSMTHFQIDTLTKNVVGEALKVLKQHDKIFVLAQGGSDAHNSSFAATMFNPIIPKKSQVA